MKLKEKKELFSKTAQELQQILKETDVELFKNKIAHTQRKLKNTRSLFDLRKKKARILTVLNQKLVAALLPKKATSAKLGGAK